MATPKWSPVPSRATAFMAIGVDTVHYYADLQALLDDKERPAGPVECFDAERYRLAFEVGSGGVVADLWRTGEQADEEVLIDRIDRIIDRRTVALDERLAKLAERGADDETTGVARETMIRLEELKRVRAFAERFTMIQHPPFWHDDPDDPDSGSAIHNCFAHLRCF